MKILLILLLLLQQHSIQNGYQVVVIDGGSSPAFKSGLEELGVTSSSEQKRGMSASRRQAFNEANTLAGIETLVWTEPEKVSFVRDCLPLALQSIIQKEADIVIPKRDEAAFSTYPHYQVAFEHRANTIFNNILRSRGLLPEEQDDLDVWMGPRVFRNTEELRKLFMKQHIFRKAENLALHQIVDPELWPNATFLPIVEALQKGLRVASVTVPYRHPLGQTANEIASPLFQRKREVQLRNIITATIHKVRQLEHHPRARISEKEL